MRIEAIATSVDGPHSAVLEPTSATIESGGVTVVDGPPGTGHTAFSLLLGGRLVPSSGRVLIDGEADGQRLRDEVALVDVPDVSEPDDVVSLATTMGEELAMARRPADASRATSGDAGRAPASSAIWAHSACSRCSASSRIQV